MLWIPQKGRLLVESNVSAVGTTTLGTTITTGASSSTKGTAVQLIASTGFDAYWVKVAITNYRIAAATSPEGCVDILIGSATEEILIPDLLSGYAGIMHTGGKLWEFPLYVPAGSRLAARAAGNRLSTNLQVAVWLYGGTMSPPFRVGGKVTAYGITVPDGVSITPGTSGGEGSWTEITSGTSEDHFALSPGFQFGGDTSVGTNGYSVDLGVGAATEEEVAQSYWFCSLGSDSLDGPQNSWPTILDVPSGTRLVMRVSNSGATNEAETHGAIYAVS